MGFETRLREWIQHDLDTMPLTSAPKPEPLGLAFVPAQLEHELHAAERALTALLTLDTSALSYDELVAAWDAARALEHTAARVVDRLADATDRSMSR